MKKFLAILMAALMLFGMTAALSSCGNDSIVVYTNAYFAPFEYLQDGKTIVGVDVDIMNMVAEKLGKKVEFQNVEFSAIIDEVNKGKLCDIGAAGITVTPARAEKVNFSDPYFTSYQYVLYQPSAGIITEDMIKTAEDGTKYVLWNDLAGKKVGVQRDTTGDIYLGGEVDEGVLKGTGAEVIKYDSAQLAVSAMQSNGCDLAIIDKLPATYLADGTEGVETVALYYKGENGEADTPTMEEYAICVNKDKPELLKAINDVLKELGKEGVDKLVKKHMGIEG